MLLNRMKSSIASCAVLAALLGAKLCVAKTVTYNFNVSWVNANPDGLFDRKVVGINGQWPLPVIEVDKGDQLVVHMQNSLGDKSASIHFHGMFQNGTNEMDGPSMVTQCPIPPGQSFTYNFTVNQNGTYWYHCHTDACYPDGYRQALIVHDKDAYFANEIEEEFTLTLSDWYHDMMEDMMGDFMSVYNPTGAEPIPDSFLMNDTQHLSVPVKPNKTYMLRLVNIAAFVGQYFYIEDHTFKIVEVDGVYTEPTEASLIYISAAQRYSILVTTKNQTAENFAMVTVADSTLLDTIPPALVLNNTNWLEYNQSAAHKEAVVSVDDSTDLNPIDDMTLVPYDQMPLLPEPDIEINVTVYMQNLITGDNYAFLNDITYTKPKVPTLYTVLSSGNESNNAAIYGQDTHAVVLGHNQVVQLVLNNADTGSHPFHLHGHNFQVITRAPAYGPDFYSFQDGDPVPYDPSNHTAFSPIPMRRDVAVLPPNGYYVIRFVADNPGVWFFHCHIDWHLASGLAMLMIEAPTQMQERMNVPQEHYDVCKAAGIPYEGNAAGRTGAQILDLSGVPMQPDWIPAGFTSRGIVAMCFSVLSAFLGIGFIIAYGLSGMQHQKNGEDQASKASPANAVTSDMITELVVSQADREKS